jgi:hypothetical protein
MGLKNIQHSKKQKVVERFKNRVSLPGAKDRKEQDTRIIDVALKSLYNDGDKVTRALQTEILVPNKIKITEQEAERLWDIMVNTGLVNSVIGFGNAGKLSLTNAGYQLMSQYGSYSAFLEERDKQAHAGQNMVFPQFIIEQSEEDEKPGDDNGDEKAVGKKKDNQ